MAPPTPQRALTGTSASSTASPCTRRVLRPSACHFEVAPTTTATSRPLRFIPPFMQPSLADRAQPRVFRPRRKPEPPKMTPTELAERYFEAMRGRDLEAVTDLFADDAVMVLPDG